MKKMPSNAINCREKRLLNWQCEKEVRPFDSFKELVKTAFHVFKDTT